MADLSPAPVGPVDPLTGIVSFVVEPETDRGGPDVFVVAATAADVVDYGFPAPSARSGSGAGLTYEDAYGAAIGECLERYALAVVHPEDLLLGSASRLAGSGHPVVGPERWALFDPAQDTEPRFSPFTPDTEIAWATVESLSERRERLVPACIVFMPYVPAFADGGERVVAPAISTGAACARQLHQGLLNGVCELVERDAFMIVWRNRLPRPRVRLDSHPTVGRLLTERFARPGLEYTLFWTTLDLELPSFCGVVVDLYRQPPGLVVGGAAHPDPVAAARKTLLELVQGLQWMDHLGAQSLPLEEGFGNVRSFEDRVRLYAFNDLREAFAFLSASGDEVDLAEVPSLDAGHASQNLQRSVQLLTGRGLEVLAVDVTPVDVAECGYHVTRVLVPGLEVMEGDHLMPFLGGQRWRKVPQRLGLRGSETTLADVNPYPHPYP